MEKPANRRGIKSRFLRNFDTYLPHYTASLPTIQLNFLTAVVRTAPHSYFHCHVVSLRKQPAILFKCSGPRHLSPSLPFTPFQAFSLPTRSFSIPLHFFFLSLIPSSFHSTLLRQSKYFIESRDYFLPNADWNAPSQIQQTQ